MIVIFQESALILLVYATTWFVLSVFLKRNDLADIAWGLGFVILCLFHATTKTIHPAALVCYLLVCTWGLRLTIFLFLRNSNKPEDFRYAQWRREWGKWVYLRSFLQVYLLQAFFLLLIISPVLFAASIDESEWTGYTVFGSMVWLVGFYWQSVGDYQLRKFVKSRRSEEEIMNRGLWKYSRHPNYFGEIVMWWGIYIIVLPFSGSLYWIVGPITITLLIRYVSGVPMLEHRYEKNENYQAYKKQVPTLFPRFNWNKNV